ncbi:MAG: dienelactone hydrolase family protein [Chitinophagales bacterium]
MKKILLAVFSLMISSKSDAQTTQQCCKSQSAVTDFALLARDSHFRSMHEVPKPADYAPAGSMITFPTTDGKSGNAYYVAAKKPTRDFLFVFHEWWGLNDWIKKEADMYADSIAGINIIALDLFDGQVATTPDAAGKLTESNDESRSKAIIKGAIDFAGKDARIATIGWCFGGGWSMQAALLAGDQEIGCVMYYGMPERDVNKLKSLNSDVLFIWAKKDQWINEKVKIDFIRDMGEAGKNITIKEYDADHAFANPSNPDFNSMATADAKKHTLVYLRKVFGK